MAYRAWLSARCTPQSCRETIIGEKKREKKKPFQFHHFHHLTIAKQASSPPWWWRTNVVLENGITIKRLRPGPRAESLDTQLRARASVHTLAAFQCVTFDRHLEPWRTRRETRRETRKRRRVKIERHDEG